MIDERGVVDNPSEAERRFDDDAGQPRRAATWGERLAQEVRRIVTRRVPALPWLHMLDAVMEHVTTLPLPAERRFTRTEVTPFEPAVHPLPLSVDDDEPEPTGLQGQLLAPAIHSRLQDVMGPGLPTIRVHDDKAADALARVHRADAVTIGHHVFFRQNRFQPRENTGFALLVHEATHVLQAMRPGTAWRRATQTGVSEEEQEASDRERRVLASPRELRSTPRRAIGPDPSTPRRFERVPLQSIMPEQPAALPALRPMTAASDRSAETTSAASAMPNIEELRRILYHDLMSQMKADFERGG